MLWKKHNYLNKNIPYIISQDIIEYDIRSAGFNLVKKYKLLDSKKIENLEKLDKKKRQIMIGLYERNDKEFKDALNAAFVEARRLFFEANNLSDDKVLSIKKDAIITTAHCTELTFDNVEFIEKHKYTSYYYINKLEFYVGPTTIDVKGISDEKLKYHNDYMIDFLFKIFKMIETRPTDIVIKNLKDFSFHYKNKTLDIGYYRELNKDSLFKLNRNLLNTMIGMIDLDSVEDIDIRYNYIHYIVPLVNLLT